MPKRIVPLLVVAALLLPVTARAAGNELSAGAGLQFNLGGVEPAGLKLFFEYGRRLGPHGSFVFQFNPLVVPGAYSGRCHHALKECEPGFSGNGYAVDLLLGGKWRWRARRSPVLGTFDLTFGPVPMWGRLFGDNGVALVGRVGGGVVVMLSRHVGLRFDGHLMAGPAFVGYWHCDHCGRVRPYVALDTGMMVHAVF